ncbi:hypothetical protein Mag101_04305 [Microbulbifer agarilyticus]|uniref:Sulfotransferase family protein n=1 Tax=Microbulbifer agarilyticus TaxID=260552 RepID=A0A1Q2M2J7_9GAMM|nr:sulfotransferase family 2 domain-containing protein [Microbulbifer agarilyticus]AQQ66945.1 hypothetical protein Mag101_04305 [Microbulbifer agarilyticus]
MLFRRRLVTSPIVFVHIPKTAGTSFRIGAEKSFRRSQVLKDYGRGARATSSLLEKHVYSETDHWALRQSIVNGGVRFLTGHFHASKYAPLFDAACFVSFVRHPVQRLVSEYHHAQKYHDYQGDFQSFYRAPENTNRQARILRGIPLGAFGFLGITERYNESLHLINEIYSTKIGVLEKNRSESSLELSQSTLDELIKRNQRDVKLFEVASDMLTWRSKLAKESLSFVHGEYSVSSPELLRGFACISASDALVRVRVRVNGREIDVVTANEYRDELGLLGLPRGGHVAFSLKLPPGVDVNQVSCEVLDTSQPLARVF